MKKVLIITYYWPPAGGPGVQRWMKFAKYLPEFGVKPFVLTVDEKYASYPVFDHSFENELSTELSVTKTKTFELYDLYKKLLNKKEIPYSGFANETEPRFKDKIVRFLRSNLFIPDPRKGWNRYALKSARSIMAKENIDIVITTSPPHSTQLIGLKLKKEFPHLRWIADLRDPWTGIYYYKQLYHSPLSRAKDRKLEQQVVLTADYLTVVGETMKDHLVKRYGSRISHKIDVLYNGYDANDFKGLVPKKEKTFTLTYTGTLSDQYNVTGFITSLEHLASLGMKLGVRIVGKVTPGIKGEILKSKVADWFKFVDQVEHKKAISYMNRADVLLLVIPCTPNNEEIITGKIFEYLACKKAILGIGPPLGNASMILNSAQAGSMFSYDNWEEMAAFISDKYKCRDNDERFDASSIEKYSRRELTKTLAEIINKS